jgi:hypothetical protein
VKAVLLAMEEHGKHIANPSEEEVKSIKVPVMGISGANDPQLKFHKRLEAALGPDLFSLTVVPGKGHEDTPLTKEWMNALVGHVLAVKTDLEAKGLQEPTAPATKPETMDR